MLKPIFDVAKQTISRAAFRDEFLQAAPKLEDALRGLVDASPELFKLLVYGNEQQILQARLVGDTAAADKLRSQHEAYRAALSDWISMINRTRELQAQVVQALQTSRGTGAVLDQATAAIAALRLSAAGLAAALVRAQSVP